MALAPSRTAASTGSTHVVRSSPRPTPRTARGSTEVLLTGVDGYAFTAGFLAWAAQRATASGPTGRRCSPVTAFGARGAGRGRRRRGRHLGSRLSRTPGDVRLPHPAPRAAAARHARRGVPVLRGRRATSRRSRPRSSASRSSRRGRSRCTSARMIEYRLKLHGLPISWLTQIEDWEPGVRFVDAPAARTVRALAPHARLRAARAFSDHS